MRARSRDRYQFAGDDGRAGRSDSQVVGVHDDVIIRIL